MKKNVKKDAPVAKKQEVNLLDLDFSLCVVVLLLFMCRCARAVVCCHRPDPWLSHSSLLNTRSSSSQFHQSAPAAKSGPSSYPVLPAIAIPTTWHQLVNKVNAKGLCMCFTTMT